MAIGIQEIIEIIEEIETEEIVGIEDPITEMIETTTEVGEIVTIEIEAGVIVEIIMVETGDLAHRIITDQEIQEVLQEGEIIVVMTEADMIGIEDDLVKAREGRKKDTTIEIIVRRVATQDLSSPGNG